MGAENEESLLDTVTVRNVEGTIEAVDVIVMSPDESVTILEVTEVNELSSVKEDAALIEVIEVLESMPSEALVGPTLLAMDLSPLSLPL